MTAATDQPGPAPLRSGTLVADRYRLGEPLAPWGAWACHAAVDTADGSPVSIVAPPPFGAAAAAAWAELRAAADRARAAPHPDIIPVHRLLEQPGRVTLVAGHFPGPSLAILARRGGSRGFAPAQVAAWCLSLAATLEAAHRVGLLHLDLVPDNLIPVAGDRLAVRGFAVSRALRDLSAAATMAAGAVADRRGAAGGADGAAVTADPSLAAMSPQVLDGLRPTAADDLYALGVALFELVAGKPPFQPPGLIARIREGGVPPLPPLAATGEAGRRAVAGLERVIAACMARERWERPPAAAEIPRLLGSPG